MKKELYKQRYFIFIDRLVTVKFVVEEVKTSLEPELKPKTNFIISLAEICTTERHDTVAYLP